MKSRLNIVGDIESVRTCQSLTDLLSKLNIPDANDILNSLVHIESDDFCNKCESHLEYCECHQEHGNRYDDEAFFD